MEVNHGANQAAELELSLNVCPRVGRVVNGARVVFLGVPGGGVVHEAEVPAELHRVEDDLPVKVAVQGALPAVKLETRVREGNPETILVGLAGLVELEDELNHGTNVLLARAKSRTTAGAGRWRSGRPVLMRHLAVQESQVIQCPVQRSQVRVIRRDVTDS